MFDLGTIGAKITLDDDQYLKKIRSTENSTLAMMKKIAGYALMYLSAKKIFGFLYDSITLASDLSETTSKFNVVFSKVSISANKAASDLRDFYGQSEESAKGMLSSTADLLTGFGFTQKAALDLSEQSNKLAVDLASFSNYSGGAEGASMALVKAMLGETEQAKMLGIAIKTETKEYRQLIKNIIATRGVTELQAKAYAALEIATSQSKNAIGDYARTQGSVANQQRLFSQRWKDLSASVGDFITELFGVDSAIASVNDSVKNLTSFIKNGSNEWIFAIKSVYYEIEAGVKMVWAFIEPLASYLGSEILRAFRNVGIAIDNIGIGFRNAQKIATWFFDNIGVFAKNSVSILEAMGMDIIQAMANTGNFIVDVFTQAGKSIMEIFEKIGDNIFDVLSGKMSISEAMGDSFKTIGEQADKTFDVIVERGARIISDSGKKTEEAFRKAGGTKLEGLEMPKMFEIAATDPNEVINKYKRIGDTLNEIENDRIKKQAKLESDLAKKLAGEKGGAKDGDKKGGDIALEQSSQGSFSAAVLALIGGGQTTQERIASATEKTSKAVVKIQKEGALKYA